MSRPIVTLALLATVAAAVEAGDDWERLTPPRRLPPELIAAAKPLEPVPPERATFPAPSRETAQEANEGFAVVDASLTDDSVAGRFPGLPVSAEGETEGGLLEVVREGASDERAKRRAAGDLPWKSLATDQRRTIHGVVTKAGLFRNFPVVRSEVAPEVVDLFATRPDVAVAIWRVMGIARCDVRETGPDTYAIDAGPGGGGMMTVVHRDDEHLLIHAVGTFSSPPLVRDIASAAVVHVRFAEGPRDELGRATYEATGSLFVAFPSSAVDAVARVVSPMTHRVIDQNFREVAMFIRLMDGTMRRRPDWVDAVATRMTGVPAERATELRAVAYRVHRREPVVAFAGPKADEFGFRPVALDAAVPGHPERVTRQTDVIETVGPAPPSPSRDDAPSRRTTRSRGGRRAAHRP